MTYYVNLGRRPDRRTRAEQQLERLGCERFERFEAIDAEQLQTDEWVRRGAIVLRHTLSGNLLYQDGHVAARRRETIAGGSTTVGYRRMFDWRY